MCTVCSFYTFYITTRGQRGLQLSIIKSTFLLKGQAKWNTAKVFSMNSQACHCQCYQMAHSWHILECLVGNRWTSHAELSHQKYSLLAATLKRNDKVPRLARQTSQSDTLSMVCGQSIFLTKSLIKQPQDDLPLRSKGRHYYRMALKWTISWCRYWRFNVTNWR